MGRDERNNPFNTWRQADGVSATTLYDRHARVIGEGDVVHILGKGDVFWRIQDLTLQMPRSTQDPPMHLRVTMTAVIITGLPGGQPIQDIIKVKDASEMPQVTEPPKAKRQDGGEDPGPQGPQSISQGGTA